MSAVADALAPKPNLTAAQHFLDLLHEDQPSECRALWLGGKTRPRPKGWPKGVTLSSDQPDVVEQLAELNAQGYDVFCLIAQVAAARLEEGKPARDRDITGTSWIGVDIDEPPAEGELSGFGVLTEAELEPTIIVETSPGRLQAIWRVDRHLTPDEARAINEALAKKFRGDPQSTNPARLFRMPGYLHLKQTTRAVWAQSIGGTGYGYNTAALAKWSGVKRAGQRRGERPHGGNITSVRDGPRTQNKTLPPNEQSRLENQRRAHAKERATDRATSPVKLARQANAKLPPTLAHALRNCEDREGYAATLTRMWPRQPGCRHHLALAAAVDLYKFGYSLEHAQRIVKRACRVAGDNEPDDRRRAVRDAYRAVRQGERVAGTGSGAPLTVFSAEHRGPDLRTLPTSDRPAERRRRVLAALESITTTDAGVTRCSCRTLAERTGVNKEAVAVTLREFGVEGLLKRVRTGVVMSTAAPSQKLPEAPGPSTPDLNPQAPHRAPEVQPERVYEPLPTAQSSNKVGAETQLRPPARAFHVIAAITRPEPKRLPAPRPTRGDTSGPAP
jgi:hypothetical protein